MIIISLPWQHTNKPAFNKCLTSLKMTFLFLGCKFINSSVHVSTSRDYRGTLCISILLSHQGHRRICIVSFFVCQNEVKWCTNGVCLLNVHSLSLGLCPIFPSVRCACRDWVFVVNTTSMIPDWCI